MSDTNLYEDPLVFGLDIGTRNVVGTVGYRTEDNEFIVVAQHVVEHETRAMLDGQIHDIGRVGRTIRIVKEALEAQIEHPLTEVCIAAAGRVLKTVTTNVRHEFPEETVVTGEDIHTLDLLGIEKAQSILREMNDTQYKFYCVGYSVVKYYLDDDPISNLESHKADRISADIIVTFLPEDVVDGLYAAVGKAGLTVANMTLEPIAAINVAIPENFRLLNIALVDIGAGTSDISVTKDGSIVAYGMIPLAGDEITELIVQQYLVDFRTAEHIKLCSGMYDKVTYQDIMLIEHTIPSKDVWELTVPVVDKMTTEVAARIKELNGGESVSAAFVVGGGGKIHGYTEMLAEKLGIPKERVALRGEEVLQEVIFLQAEIQKDPLLVTPIGICLNYYDQKNNFIMVRFNGERIKLYDNSKLAIVDAALQAGFPNEDLFPKRGRELQFIVNGSPRIVRGEPGESAEVYMNDRPVNINTPLEPNCDIYIEPSTAGADATCRLEQLDEYSASDMTFIVNGRLVRCPKLLEVNGSLELPSYAIREGDRIETRSFYTVGQLAEFMDVEVDMDYEIVVNNRKATMESLIYENFTIEWTVLSFGAAAVEPSKLPVAPPLIAEHAPKASGASALEEDRAKESSGDTAYPDPVMTEPGAETRQQDEAGTEAKERGDAAIASQAAMQESVEASVEPGESAGGVDAPVQPQEAVESGRESAEPGVETRRQDETGTAAEERVSASVTESKDADAAVAEERVGVPAEADDLVLLEEETGIWKSEAQMEEQLDSRETTLSGSGQSEAEESGVPVREQQAPDGSMLVYVNKDPIRLTGKKSYIFVDIFNFFEFDLKEAKGRAVITKVNGANAQFTAELSPGDEIEIYWE